MPLVIMLAPAVLTVNGRSHAGPVESAVTLAAADAAALDRFGGAVAISGDLLVVGADGDDDGGDQSGAAYVFHRDVSGSWVPEAKLTADDAAAGAVFGSAVAVSGNLAVVGAFFDGQAGANAGAAYVFRRDPGEVWFQEAKLLGLDTVGQDRFGNAVAIDGDFALIGAPGHDSFQGAAYLFLRDQGGAWSQLAELHGDAGGTFGSAVALRDGFAVVGAPGESGPNGTATGAAYVFRREEPSSWVPEAKLTAEDEGNLDRVGTAVAVSYDVVVVGNACENGENNLCEAAYAFRRQGPGQWTQEAVFTAEVPAFDQFGLSVDVFCDAALVGARGDDRACGGETSCNAGAVHVFRRNSAGTWAREDLHQADDPAAGDLFGAAISLGADFIVAGAPGADGACPQLPVCNSGAVYMVPRQAGPDCNANGVSDGCDFASGESLDINSDGILDECQASVPAMSAHAQSVLAILMLAAGTIIAKARRCAPSLAKRGLGKSRRSL